MTSSHLLVPIVVEALVVSDLDKNGGDAQWSLGAADYRLLTLLQVDPRPVAFNQSSAGPPTGVTLSWALPSGLTKCVAADDGTTAYPAVPNRWLVVRTNPDPDDPDVRRSTAWVVASDQVNSDQTGTMVLSPTTPGEVIYIGKVWALDDWPGDLDPPGAPSAHPLTAVGPGDVSFAAFAPGCPGVFSMHDSLSDLPASPPSPIFLTYLVVGWYANPADDPLAAADPVDADAWAEAASCCNWSVGDEDDLNAAVADATSWLSDHNQAATAPCPTRTLCHGMVYSVPWLGPGDFPGDTSSQPRWRPNQYTALPPAAPQVAVGNNSAEAIAAYLAQALHSNVTPQLETILLAFQNSLLDELDGPDAQHQLDRGIHAAPFGHQPSGSAWVTAQTDQPNSSGPGSTPTTPASLTTDQMQQLTDLNSSQRDLDAAIALAASRQQLLYSLSWQANNGVDVPPELITEVKQSLATLHTTIQQLQTSIEASVSGLATQLVDAKGVGWRLVEQPLPKWQHPPDPVLLLSGVGRSYTYAAPASVPADSGTSLVHDPPGADPDDVLFCRFSGQTIASITVADPTGGASLTIGAGELDDAGLFVPLQSSKVPAEAADLCIEAYLLDSENAPALAALAAKAFQADDTTALAETIQVQQTLVWNADIDAALDQQTLAGQGAGLLGLHGDSRVVPSLLSVSYWAAPWTPLFLDWAATFYASAPAPAEALEDWSFDDIDYTCTQAPNMQTATQTYEGRTVLTPNATRSLRQQLVTFLNSQSFQDALTTEGIDSTVQLYIASQLVATVQSMDEWDIIAQSLGGFTEMLRQLVPGWAPIQSDDTVPYLQDAGVITPQPAYPFVPLRAGAIEVTQLAVVDTFGRSVQVTHPAWFRSQALTPPSTIASNLSQIYLPPRLAAPSRLLCDLRDASDDTQSIVFNTGTTPVCGWIVPNCLDGGLSVFDGAGNLLGELYTTEGEASKVEWIAAPDTTNTPGDIANQSLSRFVNGLLTPGLADGKALTQLLESIDEAAWSSVPSGSANLTNLGNLIGRPLALARAEVLLQLPGDPPFDQSADSAALVNGLVGGDADDLATVTAGLLDVEFPVHLGAPTSPDDGLVGFCADADLVDSTYQRFHSACPVTGAGNDPYVDNNPEIAVSLHSGSLVLLLMDPFAGVVATSGVLPETRVALPDGVVNDALARMQVAFRTGPMLTQPASLQLPLPSNITGSWAWMAQRPPGTWSTTASIGAVDNLPNLSVDPTLMTEGWLVLADALGPLTNPPSGGTDD